VHDEAEYSNIAAQEFETDHHEYRLQEHEIIDELDKIIEGMDQPTIDGINTYFVSKAAASFGLKVVLSGLGGDELFGGILPFTIFQNTTNQKLTICKACYESSYSFSKEQVTSKSFKVYEGT